LPDLEAYSEAIHAQARAPTSPRTPPD
jgi:hypothetical protein